ncbi:hypothetical protein LOD99_3005 [Oopsacas minuta]|uniref:GyrI-like small molecule binding domain-containing protein n=1 Tax=Oopsacas minuta TaxID=111878 RepID=A0AAV7K0N9_9METZ|nr:hypothetical protein LOD99_3005 [Oopsacas minuta]
MDVLGYEVRLLYIILGAILLAFLAFLSYLIRSGLFYTVTLSFSCPTPDVMPQKVAYIMERGPYKNTGLLFKRTMDLMEDGKVFALYYDDPEKVPQSELQYLVGCMLPTQSEVLADHMVNSGYTIHTFPPCSNALITEYPNYTVISMYLAIWRIFPKIKKMMAEIKHEEFPVIEFCTSTYFKYIVPVDNMAKFYVPGVKRRLKTHVE